ncbi:MAG: LACI-family transcription regulator [Glaciihabitans sp.]|nr:LACI-family transcription regulator [Glaciihabitans sp.]
MQDVANALGVSLSTVSLALSGNDVVAPATRARVRDEANRLGYVYNRSAANLRTRSRDVVGLVVPDITNPFAAEAALGLQDALMPDGRMVALANTRERVDTQTSIVQALLEQRIAGLVLIPALDTSAADLALLRRSDTPVILMNRNVPDSQLPFLGTDDERVIRLAVDHLRDVHHVTSAAYFGGLQAAGPQKARKAHFRSLMQQYGIQDVAIWDVPSAPNALAAYEAAREILRTAPAPAALVCHSDSIAIGVLRALNEAHVDPSECSVIGIDGIVDGVVTVPSLTTIDVFPSDMGAMAGRLLFTPSANQPASGPLVTPALRVRESCGCASG